MATLNITNEGKYTAHVTITALVKGVVTTEMTSIHRMYLRPHTTLLLPTARENLA